MRVIFMGTPEFSVPALEAIITAGYEVVAVYTQPPRPAGRGKKNRPSAVQHAAEKHGIPVMTPLNFREEADQQAFAAHNADIAVVVAYGLILPQKILDAPKMGCLNIHASLLPRWRGAAPIHRAIMAGDEITGVCIMQMEAGLDTGPVLLRAETQIREAETTGELHDRLSAIGADSIVRVLSDLATLTPVPQCDEGVTYARKIDKAEARVDWSRPSYEVARQINGLSPFPGAWVDFDGGRLKLLKAHEADGQGEPGQVLDATMRVACAEGAVQIITLQKAGKSAQPAEVFLRGHTIAPGTIL